MKKTDTSKPQPAPEPVKDASKVLTTDEHAGRGGSYVFDPATGKRSPASETQTEKVPT
ncbi:hypothetical protein ACFQUU_27155 [Herbaspirillum sp. GCM10030257]|uniref:hypothetical protein n=1 Tax=Herbaspirillum sp. GCM10030257 TaxID=3273393 RepID=UPI0036124514